MLDTMKGLKRTHYCGEVEGIGSTVTVAGFVQRVRDKGSLMFVDLRDRTGIVQLVFDDTTEPAVFEKAKQIKSEYVLMAQGLLRERESKNNDIKTGNVEILVTDLRILSMAQTTPFEIVNDTKTNEELRLKYRYLDLRRKKLQDNLIMRHRIAKTAREYFYDNGFLEIETPMMMKSTPEARAALKMALEALRDIGDKFKADYLVNVLVGKTTALIKSYGHNKSKWFGAGAEHDARFWGAVLRQALILGLIDKNIENYGLISVNKKGEGYIALPFPVTVTLDHDYDEEEKESESVAPMGKGGAADEELFSMLKDLRKKVAKQHGLPPFVIFQDPSLEDMAVQYPITFEEMQNITGVGVGKARKFGEEFIRLIKAYVDEKEIIRPQDMIVKGVASKSGNKIFIIQSIDRKMDFEDIARAKDLDFDELLTEIEGIVNAGTKLDISYYLKEFMDEDKIEDIYLYFKEDAESDSLDAAIEELGADYTEEEIRLVRIKFMCEQGN